MYAMYVTQCRLGEAYLRTKWHPSIHGFQAFGHNGHGPKIGGAVPLLRGSWVPV